MKTILSAVAATLLLLSVNTFAEPLGTGFTYQGELRQAGVVAEGEYDFQFELFDMLAGGIAVSTTVQLDNVAVHEGIFSVELDFGTNVYDGSQLWLQVGAREGDSVGSYSTLSPRQKLTASAYALSALSVATSATPIERKFVGYTTDAIAAGTTPEGFLLAGTSLCKAAFGSTATIATSKEVLRAINEGTFFYPAANPKALLQPVDMIYVGNSSSTSTLVLRDPYLNTRVYSGNGTIELDTFYATTGIPSFEGVSANNVAGRLVFCSQ